MFPNRKLEQSLLVAIDQAYAGSDAGVLAEVESCKVAFNRRPLVRFYVMLHVRQELATAGLALVGPTVDWDAIGRFLQTIVPIILELIKLFM